MEELLKKNLGYAQSSLKSALSTFLFTNKRVDRDRVIKLNAKIEVLEETFLEDWLLQQS